MHTHTHAHTCMCTRHSCCLWEVLSSPWQNLHTPLQSQTHFGPGKYIAFISQSPEGRGEVKAGKPWINLVRCLTHRERPSSAQHSTGWVIANNTPLQGSEENIQDIEWCQMHYDSLNSICRNTGRAEGSWWEGHLDHFQTDFPAPTNQMGYNFFKHYIFA